MKIICLYIAFLLCFGFFGFATDPGPLTYNKATLVYYRINNDAQNMYLTIRADKPRIIQKILEGGISFSISPKSNTRKTVSFTYPLIREPVKTAVFDYISQPLKGNPKMIAQTADSLSKEGTKYLNMVDDLIKVNGLKLKDTLDKKPFRNKIPFFTVPGQYIRKTNNYGIRVAANFDNKRLYHYVLTIPLKLTGIVASKNQHVKFALTVNGRAICVTDASGKLASAYPSPGYMIRDIKDPATGKYIEADADLNHPTEFSGLYQLK